ncbi:MAG TPA: RluA family pseudouridine synthase [Treponema sp.]|nr:RluA family pseudouridine synthase [Treponema sp.]
MKDISVLYKDTDILLINKPCGIPVQGGAGISISLVDILTRQTGSPVFPVHRLDRETSGLLLVARNAATASRLTRLLSGTEIVKKYCAVTMGVPSQLYGSITTPVGRGIDKKNAETRYRVLATAGTYSLISAELITGRTHQIRIHLASIGCPILADDKYGNFPLNRQIRKDHGIRKLQLVANELELPQELNLPRHFIIPFPDHMMRCVESLGITFPLSIDTI